MSKDMAQIAYQLVKDLNENEGFVLVVADSVSLTKLKCTGWDEHFLEKEVLSIQEELDLSREIEFERKKLAELKKETRKIYAQITDRRKVLHTINDELRKTLESK